jgi:hypothetical protein
MRIHTCIRSSELCFLHVYLLCTTTDSYAVAVASHTATLLFNCADQPVYLLCTPDGNEGQSTLPVHDMPAAQPGVWIVSTPSLQVAWRATQRVYETKFTATALYSTVCNSMPHGPCVLHILKSRCCV